MVATRLAEQPQREAVAEAEDDLGDRLRVAVQCEDARVLLGRQDGGDLPLTLSDAQAPDQPLVWVNDAFARLTGYSREEALGRNCRFLQGPGTDRAAVRRLREAVRAGKPISEVLLNYRRDGSVFWNRVVISPVHDADGQVTHLVGAQLDVTAQVGDDDARDLELELARQTSSRLDLLRAVSDELSRHLDYETAVDALADVVVPALATWGFVAVVGERGRFERVHVVATDPRMATTAAKLEAEAGWWLERSPRVRTALDSSIELVPEPMPVHRADLPLSCPTPEMALWNSHPRVYLPIQDDPDGHAQCPYCSAIYQLVD